MESYIKHTPIWLYKNEKDNFSQTYKNVFVINYYELMNGLTNITTPFVKI